MHRPRRWSPFIQLFYIACSFVTVTGKGKWSYGKGIWTEMYSLWWSVWGSTWSAVSPYVLLQVPSRLCGIIQDHQMSYMPRDHTRTNGWNGAHEEKCQHGCRGDIVGRSRCSAISLCLSVSNSKSAAENCTERFERSWQHNCLSPWEITANDQWQR